MTTLKNYWNTHKNIQEGRASRSDMWKTLGFMMLALISLSILIVMGFAINEGLGAILALVAIVPYLMAVWVALSVQVKRIRDFGYSGWHFLTLMAIGVATALLDEALGFPLETTGPTGSLVSLISFIIFYCIRGNEGKNQYGEDSVND